MTTEIGLANTLATSADDDTELRDRKKGDCCYNQSSIQKENAFTRRAFWWCTNLIAMPKATAAIDSRVRMNSWITSFKPRLRE